LEEGDLLKYEGSFECDSEWQGQGTTSFAQARAFSLDMIKKIGKAIAQ
jgi:hypothetical protein